MMAANLTADPVMRRIVKHINATAGQHMRAIRKGFAEAGAPVTGTVEPEAQQRIPLVSEGTASAKRINAGAATPACRHETCPGVHIACAGFVNCPRSAQP